MAGKIPGPCFGVRVGGGGALEDGGENSLERILRVGELKGDLWDELGVSGVRRRRSRFLALLEMTKLFRARVRELAGLVVAAGSTGILRPAKGAGLRMTRLLR
jgi:hypothetical protein